MNVITKYRLLVQFFGVRLSLLNNLLATSCLLVFAVVLASLVFTLNM